MLDSKNSSTRPSLLIRVRDHQDAEAWQEFFDLYSPLLYSYARDRKLSHEDAEDIRASCYETIVKRIAKFRHDELNSGFRAWLRTMVERKVIDLYRKRKMLNADSLDIINLQSTEESLDDVWERNWRLHHLRYCVGQVGKRVQPSTLVVFRLLTESGLPASEVCSRMNMTADQVYKIKSRMLDMIRSEMNLYGLE